MILTRGLGVVDTLFNALSKHLHNLGKSTSEEKRLTAKISLYHNENLANLEPSRHSGHDLVMSLWKLASKPSVPT